MAEQDADLAAFVAVGSAPGRTGTFGLLREMGEYFTVRDRTDTGQGRRAHSAAHRVKV
ncbi:hypothetical protein SALBM135S_03672 [Streptomyces alboniger]